MQCFRSPGNEEIESGIRRIIQKIKPPTFDGKEEEVVEKWLIKMNKYF